MHNNHDLHGYLRPNKGEQKMKKPKFKVGDRVKADAYPLGGIGVITGHLPFPEEEYRVEFKSGATRWFIENKLRKVK